MVDPRKLANKSLIDKIFELTFLFLSIFYSQNSQAIITLYTFLIKVLR